MSTSTTSVAYEVDRDTLHRLHQKSNRVIFVTLGLHVFLVGVLCLAGWSVSMQQGWLGVLCFGLIGWAQFSLSNGMHEGLHHNFGNPHREWLAALLTAWPIGFDMSYRQTHLAHHQYFGDEEKDPDYRAYARFPQSKMHFVILFLFHISGLAAVLQFAGVQTYQSSGSLRGKSLVLLTQVGIAGLFYAGGWPEGYLLFWIWPLVSVAKTCGWLRLLCEHGSPDRPYVFRTLTGNLLSTCTLGMFRFNYHAAHHAHQNVPYTHLRELQQHAREDSDEYETRCCGYLNLLWSWWRSLPVKA